MIKILAQRHAGALASLYATLGAGDYKLDQTSKADRRLRNCLLGYLVQVPDREALVIQQLHDADNMTDRMAALSLLAHSDFASRDAELDAFYQAWQADELVIDKWFVVQGQSKREDTVERVRALLDHKAFKWTNPNRLRSLVSSFSMLNQVRFHQADGSGYQLLGEIIAKVDKINPQTAARLVAPLGRWRRLPDARQALMKQALSLVLKNAESDDVRELAEKSLS